MGKDLILDDPGFSLPIKFEVSVSTEYEVMKSDTKREKCGTLG